MIQNNNAPDILNLNAYASYAKDSLLYSPTTSSPTRSKSDLLPNFVKSGTYQGKMYGMPDLSSARALFYNKDLFAKAGIAAPPKTWDEFEADAKKITALGDGTHRLRDAARARRRRRASSPSGLFNNGGDWKTDGKWTINSPAERRDADVPEEARGRRQGHAEQPRQDQPRRRVQPVQVRQGRHGGRVLARSPPTLDKDKQGRATASAPMPTQGGGQPQTFGVTDYLMAFKKPGNQDGGQGVLRPVLPEGPGQHVHQGRGLPAGHEDRPQAFASDPKLKVYLDTLPNVHLTPTDDPTWDKVKLAVQQNIGARHRTATRRRPSTTCRRQPRTAADRGRRPSRRGGRRRHGHRRRRRRRRRRTAPGRACRRRRRRDRSSAAVALLWLGPALALIAGVVIYPAIELCGPRFSKLLHHRPAPGDAGSSELQPVLAHPDLGTVLVNTMVWVVAVVVLTLLISLALAQFLSKDFFGRKVVRYAIIVPWAASLVITAKTFMMIYDYYYGTLNLVLMNAARDQHAHRLPRQRLLDHALDGPRRGLRVDPVHRLRLRRRAQRHPHRRLRGGPHRRRHAPADLLADDAAAAAPGAARGERAQHHLRLQLVPDHLDAERPQPRVHPRHHDHVHVQAGVQERGEGRRHVRGRRHLQRPADPRVVVIYLRTVRWQEEES